MGGGFSPEGPANFDVCAAKPGTPPAAASQRSGSDKVIVCSRALALADVEWLGRGRPRVLQSVDVI